MISFVNGILSFTRMQNLFFRINGRGNAWPVSLGQEHPFYSAGGYEDLANASYSLISNNGDIITRESIAWEILIDAGHGTVQYLITHGNRLPEAMVVTHPHIDHTLGLDWVAQSYYRFNNKALYPVYATGPCRDFILKTFPNLKKIVKFRELKPGVPIEIKEAKKLQVTAYPVYHGQSAFGASMVLFEEKASVENKKILATGDILCPLLYQTAYKHINAPSLLVTDANNRFPYTGSNHWSLMRNIEGAIEGSVYLEEWCRNTKLSFLFKPHQGKAFKKYFKIFRREHHLVSELPSCIFDFVRKITPRKTALVHYSGREDFKYYHEQIFTDVQLQQWANNQAEKNNLPPNFIVPKAGDVFLIE